MARGGADKRLRWCKVIKEFHALKCCTIHFMMYLRNILIFLNRLCSDFVSSGKVCENLKTFHISLWREDMTDVSSLELPVGWKQSPAFLNVEAI